MGEIGGGDRKRRIAELLARNAIPTPTPETAHYWEGAKRGELILQRCRMCRHSYFPPRPFCPACLSRDVEVFQASGRARLYSYVINHMPPLYGPQEPRSLALVELEEGPRMTSMIVDVAQTPASLTLDMPLMVVFRQLSETIWLPVFKPVEAV